MSLDCVIYCACYSILFRGPFFPDMVYHDYIRKPTCFAHSGCVLQLWWLKGCNRTAPHHCCQHCRRLTLGWRPRQQTATTRRTATRKWREVNAARRHELADEFVSSPSKMAARSTRNLPRFLVEEHSFANRLVFFPPRTTWWNLARWKFVIFKEYCYLKIC